MASASSKMVDDNSKMVDENSKMAGDNSKMAGEKGKTKRLNGNPNKKIATAGNKENMIRHTDCSTLKSGHQLSSDVHYICLRITLVLCVTCATVGFCLLIAGGIGRHLEQMEMLMYVGIMVFLVSVTLLVIMCSTWGTGGAYRMVQVPSEQFFVPVPPPRDHMIYPMTPRYMDTHYALPFEKYSYSLSSQNSSHKIDYYPDLKNVSEVDSNLKAESKSCNVKNCLCQVRGNAVESYHITTPVPQKSNQNEWQSRMPYEYYRGGNTSAEYNVSPATFGSINFSEKLSKENERFDSNSRNSQGGSDNQLDSSYRSAFNTTRESERTFNSFTPHHSRSMERPQRQQSDIRTTSFQQLRPDESSML